MISELYFTVGAIIGLVVWVLVIKYMSDQSGGLDDRILINLIGGCSWVVTFFLWPIAIIGIIASLLARLLRKI